MEVGRWVVAEEHADHDPVEATDLWHVSSMAYPPQPGPKGTRRDPEIVSLGGAGSTVVGVDPGDMKGYRRTAATAIALIMAFAVTGALAGPVRSQTPAVPGTAQAVGSVFSVVPAVGRLEFGVRGGVAAAELTNAVASAQAQSLNFGIIETSLTAENCEGDRNFEQDDFPQPIRVDNRAGDTSQTLDEAPILLGLSYQGGRLHVEAARRPQSLAQSIPNAIDIGPVTITTGEAVSTTEVIDGHTYLAHAIVESSIEVAGMRFNGLRWEALHRIGPDENVMDGAFFIEGEGGSNLDGLQPLVEAANSVLELTGISIDLPGVEILQEPFERVRVSPLAIRLEDSPLGATLLNPLLEATAQQKAMLFEEIATLFCQLEGVLLVGDIGLIIASGNGSLTINVGGAQASARFLPEQETAPALQPAAPAPIAEPETTTTTTIDDPEPPVLEPEEDVTTLVAPVGSEGCASAHPFQWPPCSRGAAGLAGGLGLAALAAVAALDWRRQRRLRALSQ
jgi:hypothetical protein